MQARTLHSTGAWVDVCGGHHFPLGLAESPPPMPPPHPPALPQVSRNGPGLAGVLLCPSGHRHTTESKAR